MSPLTRVLMGVWGRGTEHGISVREPALTDLKPKSTEGKGTVILHPLIPSPCTACKAPAHTGICVLTGRSVSDRPSYTDEAASNPVTSSSEHQNTQILRQPGTRPQLGADITSTCKPANLILKKAECQPI